MALVERVRESAARGARESLETLAATVPVPIASIAIRRRHLVRGRVAAIPLAVVGPANLLLGVEFRATLAAGLRTRSMTYLEAASSRALPFSTPASRGCFRAALALLAPLAVLTAPALARADEPPPTTPPSAGDSPGTVPSDAAPPPRDPPRRSVRSPGMLAGGVVTSTIGTVILGLGVATYAGDTSPNPCTPGVWFCGLGRGIGSIVMAVGAVHLAVGVPLTIVGALPPEKRTTGAAWVPSVGVGPGSASLRWTF